VQPVKELHLLLTSMEPILEAGEFVFVSLPAERQPGLQPEAVISSFREKEGITFIVRREESERVGLPATFPCRMIRLNIVSDLEAIGFLARILTELAARGISVNPVSGYHHDYLFVPVRHAETALEVLRHLQFTSMRSSALP
jgi:hypothetical protein